jgi:hypothetical protein
MPDLDQIKQVKQGLRDRRGRFVKECTPWRGLRPASPRAIQE